ncbi:MAG: CAP domain-containing protein [Chloracidobacterium sp.]|nr:CAP domain-containing protein [Chloracidobacterium sp.]
MKKFLFSLFLTTQIAAAAMAQDGVSSRMALRSANPFTGGVSSSPADASSSSLIALEQNALRLVNQERSRAGLGPLSWNDKVAAVARAHSVDMAEYNYFSHKGLDGSLVDDRARKLRMGAWQAIGENIAFLKGFEDPVSTVVEKWLRSAGHRGNMLDPRWTETAIGLAVTPDGKYYFTQVFIRN